MKNTITFEGNRTAVSSSGNVEWYEFTVKSQEKLSESAVIAIGQSHGMGGQDVFCEHLCEEFMYIYKCKATCYCD